MSEIGILQDPLINVTFVLTLKVKNYVEYDRFEKLLFLYKTEGKNMSIQTFFVNRGGNYRAFDKWFRNTHKDIVLVEVLDCLEAEIREEKDSVVERPGSQETCHTVVQICRIMGIEVLKYFQTFFRKFDEGCRDFHEMIPGQLAID